MSDLIPSCWSFRFFLPILLVDWSPGFEINASLLRLLNQPLNQSRSSQAWFFGPLIISILATILLWSPVALWHALSILKGLKNFQGFFSLGRHGKGRDTYGTWGGELSCLSKWNALFLGDERLEESSEGWGQGNNRDQKQMGLNGDESETWD